MRTRTILFSDYQIRWTPFLFSTSSASVASADADHFLFETLAFLTSSTPFSPDFLPTSWPISFQVPLPPRVTFKWRGSARSYPGSTSLFNLHSLDDDIPTHGINYNLDPDISNLQLSSDISLDSRPVLPMGYWPFAPGCHTGNSNSACPKSNFWFTQETVLTPFILVS